MVLKGGQEIQAPDQQAEELFQLILLLDNIKANVKRDSIVVFKQRTARHLSTHPDKPWQYESGNVTYTTDNGVCLIWMQGHHSRDERVSYEDIVAVYDTSQPTTKIGPFRGPSTVFYREDEP